MNPRSRAVWDFHSPKPLPRLPPAPRARCFAAAAVSIMGSRPMAALPGATLFRPPHAKGVPLQELRAQWDLDTENIPVRVSAGAPQYRVLSNDRDKKKLFELLEPLPKRGRIEVIMPSSHPFLILSKKFMNTLFLVVK